MNDFFDIYTALVKVAKHNWLCRHAIAIHRLAATSEPGRARQWWQQKLQGLSAHADPQRTAILREHAATVAACGGDCIPVWIARDGAQLRELARSSTDRQYLRPGGVGLGAAALERRADVLFGVTWPGARWTCRTCSVRRPVINSSPCGSSSRGRSAVQRAQWLSALLDSNMQLREYEYCRW